MTFQVDTTGAVPATRLGQKHITWARLDPFTQGYVEAMFAELSRQPVDHERATGGWFDGFSDLAPETLARIIADCAAREGGWKVANAAVRADDATEGGRFWRDRQSGAATSFPPLTVQLSDDGKVRFAS